MEKLERSEDVFSICADLVSTIQRKIGDLDACVDVTSLSDMEKHAFAVAKTACNTGCSSLALFTRMVCANMNGDSQKKDEPVQVDETLERAMTEIKKVFPWLEDIGYLGLEMAECMTLVVNVGSIVSHVIEPDGKLVISKPWSVYGFNAPEEHGFLKFIYRSPEVQCQTEKPSVRLVMVTEAKDKEIKLELKPGVNKMRFMPLDTFKEEKEEKDDQKN